MSAVTVPLAEVWASCISVGSATLEVDPCPLVVAPREMPLAPTADVVPDPLVAPTEAELDELVTVLLPVPDVAPDAMAEVEEGAAVLVPVAEVVAADAT